MLTQKESSKLLENYLANLSHSKYRNEFMAKAKMFVDNAQGLDKNSVDAYVDWLKERLAPSTVNLHFRVIRRLYAVNDLPWSYGRNEAPRVKQRDTFRPQLGPSVMAAMIHTAMTGILRPYEQCFVSLSTIYGLRREEISNLKPEDLNLRKGTMYVAAVKGGRERYHLIPAEIKPYLEAHDFNQHYALSTLSRSFKRILRKSGAEELAKMKGIGWHAPRRSLAHSLAENGVDPFAIMKFMRWQSGNQDLAMPMHYHGNVVVDIGQKEPVTDEAAQDEDIFEKHPFLPIWRDNA